MGSNLSIYTPPPPSIADEEESISDIEHSKLVDEVLIQEPSIQEEPSSIREEPELIQELSIRELPSIQETLDLLSPEPIEEEDHDQVLVQEEKTFPEAEIEVLEQMLMGNPDPMIKICKERNQQVEDHHNHEDLFTTYAQIPEIINNKPAKVLGKHKYNLRRNPRQSYQNSDIESSFYTLPDKRKKKKKRMPDDEKEFISGHNKRKTKSRT